MASMVMKEKKSEEGSMTGKPDSLDVSKGKAELLEKWVYVLLYADKMSSVVGRVRFTKNLFLILKHFDPEAFEAAEFYPCNFGPESKIMDKIINEMIARGDIKEKQADKEVEFRLSKKGKKIAENAAKEVDRETMNKVSEIKWYNNCITERELLRYVNMDYPEYTVGTEMREIMIETVDLSEGEIIDDGPGFVVSIVEREIVIDRETFLRLFGDQ